MPGAHVSGRVAFQVRQQICTVSAAGSVAGCVAVSGSPPSTPTPDQTNPPYKPSPTGNTNATISDFSDVSGNTVSSRAGNVFGTARIQTTSLNNTFEQSREITDIADVSSFDTSTLGNPKIDGNTVVFRVADQTDATDSIYTSSGTGPVTTPLTYLKSLGINGHGPNISVKDGIVA